MKFLTATIFLCVMTNLVGLSAQSPESILIDQDSADYVNLMLVKIAEQEKAEVELLLISTRMEIAQLENTKEFLTKMEALKKEELKLENQYKEKNDWYIFLKKIQYWPHDKKMEEIQNWKEEHSNKSVEIQQTNNVFTAYEKGNIKKYVKEDERNNLLIYPPTRPCQVDYIVSDSSENFAIKKTKPANLFAFTDNKIRKQFVDREFITCNASIVSSIGGMKTLQLDISVASANASNIFGKLKAGEFIAIKLIDGKNIFLKNRTDSTGQWIPALQSIVYKAEFQIGVKQEKLLRSLEADSIIIRWSKAQDEYPIYELDFFINHFDCLEND